MIKRAVVVDDHVGIAEMASRALRDHLQLEMLPTIATFAEALVVLPQAKPDLVILDNRLGDGRGIDLILPLGRHLPHTKWLLYSGYFSPRVLMEAVVLGVNGAVSREAPEHVLVEAATQLLAGHGFFCESAARHLREPSQLKTFTPTERHILEKIAAGMEPKEIAATLGLAHKTVLNDMVAIRHKAGALSLVDLAEFAKANGLAPRW